MRTIWKYSLEDGYSELWLSQTAQVVEVGLDPSGAWSLWALHFTTDPVDRRTFRVFGTGHEVPDGWKYVGTFHEPGFVWHVFEDLT